MVCLRTPLIVILTAYVTITCSQNPSEFRLSDNHIPKNYSLKLNIDPDSTGYSGEVKITFLTKNETTLINLNLSPDFIKVNKITLNEVNSCTISKMSRITQIANITCPSGIKKNENNNLMITFTGVYRDSYFGVYKAEYENSKTKENFVATQFEPIYARAAFPCFDEPQLKAEFDIVITHPTNYTAVSNTPVLLRTTLDAYVSTQFQRTPPISTYLLGFVVSKLSRSYAPSEGGAFRISIYHRSEIKNNLGTILQYGRALLDAYGNFTGLAYGALGNKKLDFVALPYFRGTMENWGLACFQENILMDNSNKTTPEVKEYIIKHMAHLLIMQWFGDFVSLDWWANVWLTEGFATFFELSIDEHIAHLDMELERQFVPTSLHKALLEDGPEEQPLSSKNEDVNSFADIFEKLTDISYFKGGSIVRMMRGILGKDKFQQGLWQYLKENAHKNVNPTILLNTLGSLYKYGNRSFAELLHNWIYTPGYPVVNVSLSADTKSVKVQQATVDGTSNKWYVPISYTTSEEKNFEVNITDWLFDKPLNIKIESNSWIVVNVQETGFYRVNYDTALWYRIIKALKSSDMKQIHVSNRAQLLDDAFILAAAKWMGYNVAFDLAEYMKYETEFEPWVVFRLQITRLIVYLTHENKTEAVKAMKIRTLRWINAAFPPDKPTNLTTHMQKLTHNLIVDFRASLGDKQSLEEAQMIYKGYIENKSVEDYNKRKWSLCYGLQLSPTPRKDYEILLKYYTESESSFERKEILSSLACTNDPEVLRRYLSEILKEKSKISKFDVETVLSVVYSDGKLGLNVFLAFLKENLRELRERFGESLKLSDLILKPAKEIVSEEQLLKLKEITEKYASLEGMEIIKNKIIKQHMVRVKRQRENMKDVITVLTHY